MSTEDAGLVRAEVERADVEQATNEQATIEQATIEQAKAMVALIFAITPSEAVGLLSLAVDQRSWSMVKVARAVLDLSRQPRGGDLDLVRHRFTLLLFSHLGVDALVERADGHRRADLAKGQAAAS
jgi:hypothetical protein